MNKNSFKESSFDEIFDSQKNFRVLLNAMSRPCRVYALHKNNFNKFPSQFNPNILTILKTIGDYSVSYGLGNIYDDKIKNYIELNTGMPITDSTFADYVIFDGSKFLPNFLSLKKGTLEFPENNATAIIDTKSITHEYEYNLTKSGIDKNKIILEAIGPGINNKHICAVEGLDKDYIIAIKEMNKLFPLGIDVILVDKNHKIACISRTTSLEVY